MNRLQNTIAEDIRIVGVGLHSGSLVELEILPAEKNTGIVFERSDLGQRIPGQTRYIYSTKLCTTLKSGEASVSTVEHLMAAFVGLGIDNAIVRVSGPEIPILDGSAAPFIDRLGEISVQIQDAPRRFVSLDESFTVGTRDQWMSYLPWEGDMSGLKIDAHIHFPQCEVIGSQSYSYYLNHDTFKQIADARTFCHVNDVKAMREVGLALGGSLDNAVVVDDQRVLNNEGLRYADEFVRHKILDCVGDLGLLGFSLMGRIRTHKAGHALHHEFMKAVLERIEDEAVKPLPFAALGT